VKKSFDALPSGGRILLHEILMDDDGCGPLPAAAFSMLMLIGTRGRQYSLPELRGFLEPAGFTGVEASAPAGVTTRWLSPASPKVWQSPGRAAAFRRAHRARFVQVRDGRTPGGSCQLTFGARVVFLAQQANVIAQGKQPLQ